MISVFWHALNTFITFILLAIVFNRKTAFIATLLFAVHPINTEAINWISAMQYPITYFFSILILLIYTRFKHTLDKKFLLAAFCVYVLALAFIFNPWMLVAIVILPIFDIFILEKRIAKESIKNILVSAWPLVLVSGFYAIYVIATQFQGRVLSVISDNNFVQTTPYFHRVPFTVYMAVKLLVWPVKLSLYQEAPVFLEIHLALMFILILAILALAIFFLKKNKVITGLIILIFASIFPTFSPKIVAWMAADRYLYLPSLFFCITVALLFIYIEQKTKVKNLAIILTVTLASLYITKTLTRNTHWQTRKSLWEATAQAVPNSAKTFNNLGDVYGLEGDLQKAEQAFLTSSQLDPNNPDPVHNLGLLYARTGQMDLAEQQAKKALEINPNIYQSYMLLATIEGQRGNYKQARQYLDFVFEKDPENPQAHLLLQMIEQAEVQTPPLEPPTAE